MDWSEAGFKEGRLLGLDSREEKRGGGGWSEGGDGVRCGGAKVKGRWGFGDGAVKTMVEREGSRGGERVKSKTLHFGDGIIKEEEWRRKTGFACFYVLLFDKVTSQNLRTELPK